MEVITRHGTVRMPSYLPVTTFGDAYPLDDVIRPYLPRLADCLMVSYHYAKQMKSRPDQPLFIDSGGFAMLLPGARIEERADGTAAIRITTDEAEDYVAPEDVLAFQEQVADFGAPLDFPIPPACDIDEARRRQRLTIANAKWALANQKTAMRLFGCVQGWDVESYVDCARQLLEAGYSDVAIGGLVPRLRDKNLVLTIVREIAALKPCLLHAFGVGEPDMARQVIAAGATSVDSSSYVRAAADGKCWDGTALEYPSVFERVKIALKNLEIARNTFSQGASDEHR